jgi:hypothetical protein
LNLRRFMRIVAQNISVKAQQGKQQDAKNTKHMDSGPHHPHVSSTSPMPNRKPPLSK